MDHPITNVSRNNDVITIYRFDYTCVASDSVKALYNGVQTGFTFFAVCAMRNHHVFPNAIVPIVSTLHYYKKNRVKFEFSGFVDYLTKCLFVAPKDPTEMSLSSDVFDKIWCFSDFDCVSRLVDAFVEETSKKIQCGTGVIEGLTWCLNEMMDNILQHSQSDVGFIMGQIHQNRKHISICISDPGIGIYNSLKNTQHKPRSPIDEITLAIKEGVTRDVKVGQGNGM